MNQWWHHWLRRLGFKRTTRPEDIPRLLNQDALAQAMKEAELLSSHRVDVKAVSPGELPIPRRASEGE